MGILALILLALSLGSCSYTPNNFVVPQGLAPLSQLEIESGPGYDFGLVPDGNTATFSFTLTNVGTVPANSITGTALTPPFSVSAGSYPGSSHCTSLNPDESCVFTVAFSPTTEGLQQDALTFSYSYQGQTSSATLALKGTGVGVPTQWLISGSNFAVTSGCAPLTVSSADADGDPTASTSNLTVNLGGQGAGSFYSDTQCTNAITTISFVNGMSTAAVYFADGTAQNLTLTVSDGSNVLMPASFALTVSSGAFLYYTAGSTYAFGSLPDGTLSNVTLTLDNEGVASATALSGGALPPPFSYLGGSYPGTGGTCGTTLAAGTSCTLVVQFAPTTSGAFTSSLEVVYNPGTGGASLSAGIQLSGTGTGLATELMVSGPTSITAGICNAYTATITDNNGNPTNAQISTTVTLGGAGAGNYFSDPGCSQGIGFVVIAADTSSSPFYFSDSTGQTVTMTARNVAYATGNLSVTVLTDALLTISDGATYNFGTTTLNDAVTHVFSVTNSGQVAATSVAGTALTSPFYYTGGSFPGINGTCTATLAGNGGSCLVEVGFNPATSASFNDTMTLVYFSGVNTLTTLRPMTGIGVVATQPFHVANLFSGQVNSIAMAPNGVDLYVVGDFDSFNSSPANGIIKILSNWTVDTTFNSGGTGFNTVGTSANGIGGAIIIPVDNNGTNQFYVGGSFSSYNGTTRANLVRINLDGSLDTTFMNAPIVGFNSRIYWVQVNNLGAGAHEVYALGNFSTYNGTAVAPFVRLDSSGNLDTTFNNNLTSGGGFVNNTLGGFAISGSGNTAQIYVVGNFLALNGTAYGRILRLNHDGTVDTTFNSGQVGFNAPYTTGQNVWNVWMAPDATGDIFVTGAIGQYNGTTGYPGNTLMRLTSTGAVNATFPVRGTTNGITGIIAVPGMSGDFFAGDMAGSWNGIPVSGVTHFNSTGVLQTSFAQTTAPNGSVNTIAADTNGNVYAGGSFTRFGENSYNYIVKLDSNGSIDPAVQAGVGLSNGNTGNFDQINLNFVLPILDGFRKIILAGTNFDYYNGRSLTDIARINPDASNDFTFSASANSGIYTAAPATDGTGDFVLGGAFTNFDGINVNHIVRIQSAGNINPNFNIGSGFNNFVDTVVAQPGGTGLYVGGLFTQYQQQTENYIVRLTATGGIDTGFSTGTGFNGQVYKILPVNDGTNDIYVGGAFTTYNGTTVNQLVRLTSTGAISGSFSAGTFNGGGVVWTMALATDGSRALYVGGTFTSYNGIGRNRLMRLTSSGTFDAGFAETGANNTVQAILVATDGTNNVYIGGNFSACDGVNAQSIIRLTSSGAVDPTFVIGSGFDSNVSSITSPQDGSTDILVGGQFRSYDGITTDAFVRLHSNGTVY